MKLIWQPGLDTAEGLPTGGGVHLEFVMDVGRLPSGGDVNAPAEDSGPTFVKGL
jgi:hypothetical protein